MKSLYIIEKKFQDLNVLDKINLVAKFHYIFMSNIPFPILKKLERLLKKNF